MVGLYVFFCINAEKKLEDLTKDLTEDLTRQIDGSIEGVKTNFKDTLSTICDVRGNKEVELSTHLEQQITSLKGTIDQGFSKIRKDMISEEEMNEAISGSIKALRSKS
tara:strand:- start:465 stop:788 length:324 start_codon:yes stop_codon:yes gene_type:complete